MIAFTQGEYIFLNYVDQVSELTPLIQIRGIDNEHVETPTLSANSVIIYKSGTIKTSGSPLPGGIIYLQNNYVAIDYHNDKNYFILKYSSGYTYYSHYSQLLPTAHMSTPLSRLLKQPPKSLVFVDGGTVATYDDIKVAGLQADYIALDGGKPIAYFGVKNQTYYTLPIPSDKDPTKWFALANLLKNKGGNACLQNASAVEGLMNDPGIMSHINVQRERMKNYQSLELDISIASAFIAPASDSLSKDGTVNSCLSIENTRLFFSDEVRRKGDEGVIKEDLVGIVINFVQLEKLIKNGLSHVDLFSYVNDVTSNIPEGVVCLLNSDFQAVLQMYNELYNEALMDVSKSALIRMRADLAALKDKIDNKCGVEFSAIIANILKTASTCQNATVSSKAKPSWDLPIIHEIDEFIKINPEDAHEWLQKAKVPISMYASDCDLTEEQINQIATEGNGDLAFINVNALETNYNNSWVRAQAIESMYDKVSTLIDGVVAKLQNLTLEVDDNQYNDEGRYWGFGKKEGWHFNGLNDQPLHGVVNNITVFNTSIKFDASFHASRYDADVLVNFGGFVDKIAHGIKNLLSGDTYGFINVNIGGVHHQNEGMRGWNADRWRTWSESRNCWGDISSFTIYISFEVDLKTNLGLCLMKDVSSLQLSLPTISHMAEIAKPSEVKAHNNTLANLFSTAAKVYAADKAYKVCEPLLQGIKDAYEFQCIGTIGLNYDGVMVAMQDLAKVAAVDEHYVSNLIKLIEGLKDRDIELYNKLQLFARQLEAARAQWKTTKPIVYISQQRLTLASKIQDKNAAIHYLLGAF